MTSIFGNGVTAGSTSGNRHLVEFKAGRMNLVGKMVHPDQRKGLLYVYSAEDGLIHFCWKDRSNNNVEDDLIIFPDDCEFKRVDQCKTGRVFLLRFKSSNRKLFFWAQEPETDKDEEWCRRINEVMNNPPSSSLGGNRSGGAAEGGDLQYMLNNMSQQQLMQLFGGVGQMGGLSSLLGSMNRTGTQSGRTSATTTPSSGANRTSAAATPVTPANTTLPPAIRDPRKPFSSTAASTEVISDSCRVLMSELQSYLAGMKTGGSTSGSKQNVDLSTSLNSESISTILSDSDRLTELSAHLPNIEVVDGEEMASGIEDVASLKQNLKDTLASPQFQQALSMFSNALQSGQLGPVVSQFKLNDEAVAAANTGDLEQFLQALEKNNTTVDASNEPKIATPDDTSDDKNDK